MAHITDELLLDNGFTRYNPSPFSPEAVYCFQKCYRDENGIRKYFIDVTKYDFSFTDRVTEDYVYEISGQYYQKGTHDAINMTFIGWELEDVESFLESLLAAGFIEKYEENE